MMEKKKKTYCEPVLDYVVQNQSVICSSLDPIEEENDVFVEIDS